MSARITASMLEGIISYMQGACISLKEAVEIVTYDQYSEEDLTDVQLEHIASEIFECKECGWWYAYSEHSNNQMKVCTGCETELGEL